MPTNLFVGTIFLIVLLAITITSRTRRGNMHIKPIISKTLKILGVLGFIGVLFFIFWNYKTGTGQAPNLNHLLVDTRWLTITICVLVFLCIITKYKDPLREWSTTLVHSGVEKTTSLAGSTVRYTKKYSSWAPVIIGGLVVVILLWYYKGDEISRWRLFKRRITPAVVVPVGSPSPVQEPVYTQPILARRCVWSKRFETPSWKSADFSAKPDGLIHVRITYLNGEKSTFLDGPPNDPRVRVGYRNLEDIWYVEYMSAEKHRDVNVMITYR